MDGDRPSKSQLKRDAQRLRDLGAELAALPAEERAALPLPARVSEAIEELQRMRSHGARKRQLGYLGKQLRSVDVEPIEAALERRRHAARGLAAAQHRVEAWRDRLLAEGDAALAELLDQRPDADAQRLRQLIRNARQEAARERPPAAARQLFRALRALDEAGPLPGREA